MSSYAFFTPSFNWEWFLDKFRFLHKFTTAIKVTWARGRLKGTMCGQYWAPYVSLNCNNKSYSYLLCDMWWPSLQQGVSWVPIRNTTCLRQGEGCRRGEEVDRVNEGKNDLRSLPLSSSYSPFITSIFSQMSAFELGPFQNTEGL